MRLPRDLSGRVVAKALVIPDHNSLRVGTLNAIIKAVASHKCIDKNRVVSYLTIR